MKRTLIAAMMMFSFVGMVHAKSDGAVLKDIPIVAKCMEMHQFASIAWNSADPEAQADYDKFMKENFTDEQKWNYDHLISEWNADSDIKATYNALRGPDIHGWSLTPATMMAACVKSM